MKAATGNHGGTSGWLVQRYTAVVGLLAGFALWLFFLRRPEMDFQSWHGLFQKTSVRFLVWLLVTSICLHAWIGLRNVLMDYAKPLAVRQGLSLAISLVLILCVVWVTDILWRMNG